MLRNLGDAYVDATTQLPSMLEHGRLVHAYGVFYPCDSRPGPRSTSSTCSSRQGTPTSSSSSQPSWWGQQVRKLADFYLRRRVRPGSTTFDYRHYRTDLTMEGRQSTVTRQETDTISRLVYGLATAYLMSGNERYQDAAVAGPVHA